METNAEARFTIGKQSSLAPEGDGSEAPFTAEAAQIPEDISSGIRLMFLANEGDLDGIREALDSGADVDFRDIDGRTALHVAACQGYANVVELLMRKGADVDTQDRWGSTVLRCVDIPTFFFIVFQKKWLFWKKVFSIAISMLILVKFFVWFFGEFLTIFLNE